MRNLVGWIHYIELLVIIVALLATPFILIAAIMARAFGARAIWRTWVIFVPMVSASCVYILSWIHSRISSGPAVPAASEFVGFTVWLGLPLACGAYVLHRLTRQHPAEIRFRQLAAAWCVCLAAMPMTILFLALAGWARFFRGVID